MGSTIKVAFELSNLPDCEMRDCDFCVDIWVSDKNDRKQSVPDDALHFTKELMVDVDNNTYIAEVKTGLLKRGYVIGRIVAQVPDSECPSGWRTDIEQAVANIIIE